VQPNTPREHGTEANEQLLDSGASARADANGSIDVAQEILNEKRTEVSACAHVQDAGRRLAATGRLLLAAIARSWVDQRVRSERMRERAAPDVQESPTDEQ